MEKLENPFPGKRALSGLATTRHCLTDERKGMEMLRWKIKENGKIKMEAIKDAEMEKGDEHKDRNGSAQPKTYLRSLIARDENINRVSEGYQGGVLRGEIKPAPKR